MLKHFSQLLAPRVERTRQHGLLEIISIAILAVLCGADSFVAIETYGLALQSWLESFLDLPHGIPSHDRFGRVFGMLDPQELGACFLAWVESLVEKLDIEPLCVNLLKREPSRKSIAMKRYTATQVRWDYPAILS